ncbi:MAG: hypothetical protein NVSMB26_08600 [Beijerinckiaceae bacterium]
MHKLALIGAASLLSIGCAYAEETTVIHRDAPPPAVGVVVGAPAAEHRSTTVTTGGVGCETKTVHKENDLGDSKTVKKTDC